jgi:hypothetical protein
MNKASAWMLSAGLMLAGAARSHGQPMSFPGGQTGQAPQEFADGQRLQEQIEKEASPELYAFQKKLKSISARIDAIGARMARKQIDRESAREQILPLIVEQQKIQNDPEYLCEQRLAQLYFSTPEAREKTERIMRAFNEKQKKTQLAAPR